ncbi:MAG TPA: UDP-N-acetylglucosamine diphosphorylase, partial [Opitutaceae bacterium]|nr:UDP-N-acetylglucosamine diphosphorylase [Opitutaceae bacterium]
MKASDFFSLPASLSAFGEYFPPTAPPWEWLKKIGPALAAHPPGAALPPLPSGVHVEGPVYLHPTVKLPPAATLIGPAWIGAETEIR